MSLIADILLAGGAIGVAVYCFVLSRRLTRFTDLERGVGGAVAVLSAQVDDLTKAMRAARAAADASGENLEKLTDRAEDVARRLELHVASLHDLDPAERRAPAPAKADAPANADEPAKATEPAKAEEPAKADPPAPEAAEAQVAEAAPAAAPAEPAREEPQLRAVPTFRSVSAQGAKPAPSAPAAPAARKVPSYFANRAAAPAK